MGEDKLNNKCKVIGVELSCSEKEEVKIIILRKAIIEGLESGRAIDFDPTTHLSILKARVKGNY